MELVAQVTTILGGDEGKAKSVLGSLFTSVRMSIDIKSFAHVSAAFPQLDEWMGGIMLAQGRTGEIIALASGETLKKQLRLRGLSDEQIQQAGAAVGAAIKQAVPKDVSERIFQRVTVLGE